MMGSNSSDFTSEAAPALLTTVQRFSNAVADMEKTVMIPSKLVDMEINPSEASQLNAEGDLSMDLKMCYKLLTAIKGELVTGTVGAEVEEATSGSVCSSTGGSEPATPSTDSPMGSPLMSSRSSLASTESADEDSGVPVSGGSSSTSSCPPSTLSLSRSTSQTMEQVELARAFRHHMKGLSTTLEKLSGYANLLSKKYQDSLGDYHNSNRLNWPL